MDKTAALNLGINLNAPTVLNADLMTSEEIHAKLQEGYDDVQAGRVQDAVSAFAKFKEKQVASL